jgi:hypothetical protein
MGCAICGADVALYIRDVPFCSNCELEVVEDRKTLPIVERPQPEQATADVVKTLDAEVESALRRFKLVQRILKRRSLTSLTSPIQTGSSISEMLVENIASPLKLSRGR